MVSTASELRTSVCITLIMRLNFSLLLLLYLSIKNNIVATPTIKKEVRLMKIMVLCTWFRMLICQYLRSSRQRKRERMIVFRSQNIEVTNKNAQNKYENNVIASITK